MSDEKKPGLGLFINKKTPGAAPAAVTATGKPKDVRKRWIYVGVAAVGVVVLGSSLFGSKTAPTPVSVKKSVSDNTISVEPPKADKALFESQFAEKMAQMETRVTQLASESAQKDKALEQLRLEKDKQARLPAGTLPDGIVAPPSMNAGGLGQLGATPPAPPAPPTPKTQVAQPGFAVPAVPTPSRASAPELPAISPSMSAPSGDPMVFDAPGKSAAAGSAAGASNGMANVQAKVQYRKNENAGMLPAGSFAPVVLLNGLDAGTSAATQANPMPVLMNVLENATLPGSAKYRIKNCFVLGTGYGDLSAERVYVRYSRLSCVDKADRLVLSQEVAGYVVDSDGKLGLRGKVMDRQGAKLGKSLLAGFAQGLAGALGQAQGVVSSNITTGTTSSAISGGAALRASGLSGAQVAASQLAEFYLKEAQSIFPVISVDTGRTATIVFTGTVGLNWGNGETQFVKEVQPN